MAANGISAGYNLLQLVRCFVGMMKGSVLFGKGFAFVVFSCDQVKENLKCFIVYF